MRELVYIPQREYEIGLPQEGQHILAQQTKDEILVYQAFNHQIADFALENQHFGGNHYSFNRMSWIKPNFLWMMFRSGWASKENQERVLGIWIKKSDFEKILKEAVFTSFQPDVYESRDEWKNELRSKEVRLQWDPDHNIHGSPLQRRAIQLGLKGHILNEFGKKMVLEIVDMTDFVLQQSSHIKNSQWDDLLLLKEEIFLPKDAQLMNPIKLDFN